MVLPCARFVYLLCARSLYGRDRTLLCYTRTLHTGNQAHMFVYVYMRAYIHACLFTRTILCVFLSFFARVACFTESSRAIAFNSQTYLYMCMYLLL